MSLSQLPAADPSPPTFQMFDTNLDGPENKVASAQQPQSSCDRPNSRHAGSRLADFQSIDPSTRFRGLWRMTLLLQWFILMLPANRVLIGLEGVR